MKKLTIILVTLLMVTTGCLWAQNHRHTDRSNEAAVESIANIAISDTADVEEVFGEFIGNDGAIVSIPNSDRDIDETGASIAKVAIIAVFGCLALIIIVPILVIALIIYLIVRNNKNKREPEPAVVSNESSTSNNYDTAEKPAAPVTPVVSDKKSKMERGIHKLAIGVGFAFFGWWCHTTLFTAIGVGLIVYGAGLICIDIFADKK